jgi:hypothetical protein
MHAGVQYSSAKKCRVSYSFTGLACETSWSALSGTKLTVVLYSLPYALMDRMHSSCLWRLLAHPLSLSLNRQQCYSRLLNCSSDNILSASPVLSCQVPETSRTIVLFAQLGVHQQLDDIVVHCDLSILRKCSSSSTSCWPSRLKSDTEQLTLVSSCPGPGSSLLNPGCLFLFLGHGSSSASSLFFLDFVRVRFVTWQNSWKDSQHLITISYKNRTPRLNSYPGVVAAAAWGQLTSLYDFGRYPSSLS